MVKLQVERLTRVFTALSDPTRRAILGRLAEGEASITELAEPFDVTLPAITKHLRVLETAGLLDRKKVGRVNFIALRSGHLREAADWLSFYQRFWDEQLDHLEGHFAARSQRRKTQRRKGR